MAFAAYFRDRRTRRIKVGISESYRLFVKMCSHKARVGCVSFTKLQKKWKQTCMPSR